MTNADPLPTQSRKLPTPEAASYLGLGKSTLDKLRLTGGGPVYSQFRRRVIYDVRDLDAWFAAHKRISISDSTASAA